MGISGRPTLADVAARAGVSLKTASRALNAEYGVAPETAHRVRTAADELGFRLNHLARSLAAGRPSATVGLVISNVADHFIAVVNGVVETAVAPRGLHLVTASHRDDHDQQRRIVRTLIERRVDALLLMPAPGPGTDLADEIARGLTVVAIDRPLEGVEVDTVTVDNVEGARTAVRRLLDSGHRRVAMLADDSRLWTIQRRLQGYTEALAEAGLGVDPDLLLLDCRDMSDPRAAIRRLFAGDNPPTALFSAQQWPGRLAMREISAAGRDVDVATFDDIHDPDLLRRPPFVVMSDAERIGSLGAQLLLERLDGLVGPSRTFVLPPQYLDAASGDVDGVLAASASRGNAPAADTDAVEVIA